MASVTLQVNMGQLGGVWSALGNVAARTGADLSTAARLFAETTQVFKDQALSLEIVKQAQIAAIAAGLDFYELERSILPIFKAMQIEIDDVGKWFSYLIYIQDQTGVNADFLAKSLSVLGAAVTSIGATSEEAQKDILVMAAALGEVYKVMPDPNLAYQAARFLASLGDPRIAVRLEELGLKTRNLAEFIGSIRDLTGDSAKAQQELYGNITRVANMYRAESRWLLTLIGQADEIFELVQRTLHQSDYSLTKFRATLHTVLVQTRILASTFISILLNLSRIGVAQAFTTILAILNVLLRPLNTILSLVASLVERFTGLRVVVTALVTGFITIRFILPLIRTSLVSIIQAMELLSQIQMKLIYAQQRAGASIIIPSVGKPQPTPPSPAITSLIYAPPPPPPVGEIKKVSLVSGQATARQYLIGMSQGIDKVVSDPKVSAGIKTLGYILTFTIVSSLVFGIQEALADGRLQVKDIKRITLSLGEVLISVGLIQALLFTVTKLFTFFKDKLGVIFTALRDKALTILPSLFSFDKALKLFSTTFSSVSAKLSPAIAAFGATFTSLASALAAILGGLVIVLNVLAAIDYFIISKIFPGISGFGQRFFALEAKVLQVIGDAFIQLFALPGRLLTKILASLTKVLTFGAVDLEAELRKLLPGILKTLPAPEALKVIFNKIIGYIFGFEFEPEKEIERGRGREITRKATKAADKTQKLINQLGKDYGEQVKDLEKLTQQFEKTAALEDYRRAIEANIRALRLLDERIKVETDVAKREELEKKKQELIRQLNQDALQGLNATSEQLAWQLTLGLTTINQANQSLAKVVQAIIKSGGAYLKAETIRELTKTAIQKEVENVESYLSVVEDQNTILEARLSYLEGEAKSNRTAAGLYFTTAQRLIENKRQIALIYFRSAQIATDIESRAKLMEKHYSLLKEIQELEAKAGNLQFFVAKTELETARTSLEAKTNQLDYLKGQVERNQASLDVYTDSYQETLKLKQLEAKQLLILSRTASEEDARKEYLAEYFNVLGEIEELKLEYLETELASIRNRVETASMIFNLGKSSQEAYKGALNRALGDLLRFRARPGTEAFEKVYEAVRDLAEKISSFVKALIERGGLPTLTRLSFPAISFPRGFITRFTGVSNFLANLRQATEIISRIPFADIRAEVYQEVSQGLLGLFDIYREFAVIGLKGAARARQEFQLAVQRLNILKQFFYRGLATQMDVLQAELDVERLRAAYIEESLSEQERILELEVELGLKSKQALLNFYKRRKDQATSYLEQLEWEKKIQDLLKDINEATKEAGKEVEGLYYGFEGLRVPTLPEIRAMAGLWTTPIYRPLEFNQSNTFQIYVNSEVDINKVTTAIETSLKINGLTRSLAGVF